MAVTRVAPRWEGRGATTDEKGVRTLKRQWTVETDSDLTGEPEVVDSVVAFDPSAALYAPHPNWATAVCRNIEAAPYGGPRVWLVDAAYSSAPFAAAGDGSGTAGNTTSPSALQANNTRADLRPPTITSGNKEVTVPLEKDVVTGDPISNNLGDPFDPPVEVSRSRGVITFKFFRTLGGLRWNVRNLYRDSVNADIFTVLDFPYPPFSLRCTDLSFDTVWETGAAGLALYFAVTVQVEHKPDLWKVSVLNTGRRKRVAGSIGDPGNPPRLVAIVDDPGQPVADPVPLDAGGVPVALPANFVYRTFDGYVPRVWGGALGLIA